MAVGTDRESYRIFLECAVTKLLVAAESLKAPEDHPIHAAIREVQNVRKDHYEAYATETLKRFIRTVCPGHYYSPHGLFGATWTLPNFGKVQVGQGRVEIYQFTDTDMGRGEVGVFECNTQDVMQAVQELRNLLSITESRQTSKGNQGWAFWRSGK